MIAGRLHLDDAVVAVAGDWHGNYAWTKKAIAAIAAADPAVTTILHAGDFWPSRDYLALVDAACQRAGIERVLVTGGNHEPWGELQPLLDAAGGAPVQLSDVVHFLPRPYRFTIAGAEILSLGGAASVDRLWRVPGKEWWQEEQITDQMVQDAIAGGTADVMITHETPEGSPVSSVAGILRGNPLGFPEETLAESADSRQRVGTVWDALRPHTLFHGHMHAPGAARTSDGRRVISLGCDDQAQNVVLWDVLTDDIDDVTI